MSKINYIGAKLATAIKVNQIMSVHYSEFNKDFKFKGESHNFWEFVYVDKGEIIATAKKNEIKLTQGEIIFHKPNEYHSIKANGEIAPNVFIMSFISNSKSMNFFKGKYLKLPPKLKIILEDIIKYSKKIFSMPSYNPNETILKVKENSSPFMQQLIKIHLEELLLRLILDEGVKKKDELIFLTTDHFENTIVSQILEICRNSIYKNLQMTDICETLNFSRAYISKSFKEATGYTVMHYYSMIKIAEAKKIIREKNYNITQISNMLMYDNPQYFSRVFKSITGLSPREYQNSVNV